MTFSYPKIRLFKITALELAISVVLVILFVFMAIPPWSKFNCWTYEIDIQTGEWRYRRYILWRMTDERLDATWMSGILDPEKQDQSHEWRLVSTFSPGTRYSPHHRFHSGTTFTMMRANAVFKDYDIPHERKLKLANELKAMWARMDHSEPITTDPVSDLLNECRDGRYPAMKAMAENLEKSGQGR